VNTVPEAILGESVTVDSELSTSIPHLDDSDIKNLKHSMLLGIYALNATLFTQARFEHNRIEANRKLIEILEKEIFDPTRISEMSPSDKISLYHAVKGNMRQSVIFMQDLHKNTSSSLEILKTLETESSDSDSEKLNSTNNSLANQELKKLLLEKIAEKVLKGK